MNELHAYSSLEKRVYIFQEQWLTRHARGVTVASKALQQLVAGMVADLNQILYLPNCVENLPGGNGTAARTTMGLAADRPVLLLYTRFFEFSQQRLYALFAAIHCARPEVRFLVVGTGRNHEEELLRKDASDNGYADALIMAGWVEPERLPDLLACGDLAVYPFDDNLVNRAKCPAKLTELLLAGVPVIGDRVGQIPEYLAPELHTFLCEAGDVNGMAGHCIELLDSRSGCRKLGRTGRSYIIEHFRWVDYAAKLEQFYQVNLELE